MSAPSLNRWKLRVGALAVVAAWLVGFGLYCRARMRTIPREQKPRAYDVTSSARLRDPATGRLQRPADAPAYDPDFDD